MWQSAEPSLCWIALVLFGKKFAPKMHSTSVKKRVHQLHSTMSKRSAPRSKNAYLQALAAFYTKVADNTSVLDIKRIAKRLKMSNNDKQPVRISAIAKALESSIDKVAVVVAKVLDDETMIELPPMKIVALGWSKGVKEKIEKYNGSIATLDQLFKMCPDMEDICLLSTSKYARKSAKYWGPPPGVKGSKTFPRVIGKPVDREERVRMKGWRRPKTEDEEFRNN
jgi:large subunit ribosomal protein L18e